jgi:hypothetical protein
MQISPIPPRIFLDYFTVLGRVLILSSVRDTLREAVLMINGVYFGG